MYNDKHMQKIFCGLLQHFYNMTVMTFGLLAMHFSELHWFFFTIEESKMQTIFHMPWQ